MAVMGKRVGDQGGFGFSSSQEWGKCCLLPNSLGRHLGTAASGVVHRRQCAFFSLITFPGSFKVCRQLYFQATATHCNSAHTVGLVPFQAVVRTEKEIQKEKLPTPLFSVFPHLLLFYLEVSPGSCHPAHSAGRLGWEEEPRSDFPPLGVPGVG